MYSFSGGLNPTFLSYSKANTNSDLLYINYNLNNLNGFIIAATWMISVAKRQ